MFDFGDLKSLIVNIASTALWVIVGAAATLTIGRVKKGFQRTKIRKANEKSLKATQLLTISGSRAELTSGQFTATISGEVYKIPYPNDKIERIRALIPDFGSSDPIMTSNILKLKDDAAVDIPNIDSLLQKAVNEVAEDFIHRVERMERLFNGEMYHALSISASATNDDREDPNVNLSFYTTDYFTHQVIHRTFSYVRDRIDLAKSIEEGEIRRSLRFFLNGFGLNCVVCAFPDRSKPMNDAVLLLSRRSHRVGKNAATGTWHVSANEALSKTDIEDQSISIGRWIRRALHDEIGIREAEILRRIMFNVSIGLKDMQPGLLCLVMCEINPSEIINRIAASQDGAIEADAFHLLPFDNEAISKALHRGGISYKKSDEVVPFSPSADNILRQIVARDVRSLSP